MTLNFSPPEIWPPEIRPPKFRPEMVISPRISPEISPPEFRPETEPQTGISFRGEFGGETFRPEISPHSLRKRR